MKKDQHYASSLSAYAVDTRVENQGPEMQRSFDNLKNIAACSGV